MKIYTSYFYQIRFFKPNMIPISTALWDPKWYHQNRDQRHWFIDKNGVINGLRAEEFAPGPIASQFCRGTCDPKDPNNCHFLKAYSHQLNQLDIDNIITRTENLCAAVRPVVKYTGDPIAVFIVHEAPNNPCSERAVIQNYFKSHGINCEEWKKE